MAWIESHQTLLNHPKLLHFASLMCWEKYETIGRLQSLWWWCLDYSEDGDTSRWPNDTIAAAMGLDQKQGDAVIKALKEAKWIDENGLIHDWWDYVGLYLQRKYGNKKPEKWRSIQRLYSNRTENYTLIDSTNQPNQPNQPTKNYRSKNDGFDEFWIAYPRKTAKQNAIKAWNNLKPDSTLLAEIMRSVENHKQSRQWQEDSGKYIPHAATWLNGKRWSDVLEPAISDAERKKREILYGRA